MRTYHRLWLPGLAFLLLIALGVGLRRTTTAQSNYDLPGFGYEKGKANARVVLIEFADFGCPACAAFARETLPRVEREWVASGRVRLRVIPIDVFRSGRLAARAAQCAAEQEKFWPMQSLLFAEQRAWLGKRGQRDTFERFALRLKLDTARFRVCWKKEENSLQLTRNTEVARERGVPGTPAFIVNGRPLVGAVPYEQMAALLDSARTQTSKSVSIRAARR